ncbi:MFS transporter [Janthinobacterium sp. Mn2066]|uniref:MFS transporter n=1 Tax=Janthinobacterium sp. Mn2066 TaxID=3395264 RepID=UPI003BED07FC
MTAPPVAPAPLAHPFGPRILTGVVGVFVAAMMSGLNSRIGGLAFNDIRAAFGMGIDDGSWITSLYGAFELAAMPFSAWFAITFSFRRYHLSVVAIFAVLGLLTPLAPNVAVLLVLRCLQGFFGGLLIPVLMAAALRFFPLPLRLYGLALYAMTATFAPNVATWLSATWTDTVGNWHLLFWQTVPMAAFSLAAVAWGIPQDPVRLERFRQINLTGLVTGLAGLVLLGVALSQGERLDWFNSPLLCWLGASSLILVAIFLLSEWFHPLPFIKLQLLSRRNLGLGFSIFVGLLVVLLSGSLLPADYLGHAWHHRTPQLAIIGLQVGLPQFLAGPAVSYLLYQPWMDARRMFAGGLLLIATACWYGAQLTPEWMATDFVLAQALHAIGQPMAVISLLFLATSVVQPMEGPQVSGIVNGLRALGTLLGSALVGRLLTVREATHANVLLDQAANMRRSADVALPGAFAEIAHRVSHQAFVLSIADAYLVLGALALLLIPLVLSLEYIAPPVITAPNH